MIMRIEMHQWQRTKTHQLEQIKVLHMNGDKCILHFK